MKLGLLLLILLPRVGVRVLLLKVIYNLLMLLIYLRLGGDIDKCAIIQGGDLSLLLLL